MNKKLIALLLTLVLLVGVVAGGTIAWLTAKTDAVTNTFTVGDINIELTETDASDNKKDFPFVPGDKLTKDPLVTVVKGSEQCYVFVKIEVTNNEVTEGQNTVKVLTWAAENNWKAVPGQQNPVTANGTFYFYQQVAKSKTADTTLKVLASDEVSVSQDVTKEMHATLTDKKPTITVTAAAIQVANIEGEGDTQVTNAFNALPDGFGPEA